MVNIALYQPKIPGNTGSIIRFCANTDISLHLIHPLGFSWDDTKLKRAGLDYSEFANITHYENWNDFITKTKSKNHYIITTKATKLLQNSSFKRDDFLIFGSEDSGICPNDMQAVSNENWIRVPMVKHSRSMNLANTVSIVGFEALRQVGLNHLG